MFTIYRKDVGGRIFDRYFKSWDNAKALLEEEEKSLVEKGWEEINHVSYFNSCKGFYVFYYVLKTPEGEKATLTLIDAEFAD